MRVLQVLALTLLAMSASYTSAYGRAPPPPPPPPEYPETVEGYDVGDIWISIHRWVKFQVREEAKAVYLEEKLVLDRLNGDLSQELAFEYWGDRYWYREFGSYHKVCGDVECAWHFLHVSIPYGSDQARPQAWVENVFNVQKIVDFLREQNIPQKNILQQDIDYSGYADPASEIREKLVRVVALSDLECPAVQEIAGQYAIGDPERFKLTLNVPHKIIAHGIGAFLNFGPTEEAHSYEVRGPGPVVDLVAELKRPLEECLPED